MLKQHNILSKHPFFILGILITVTTTSYEPGFPPDFYNNNIQADDPNAQEDNDSSGQELSYMHYAFTTCEPGDNALPPEQSTHETTNPSALQPSRDDRNAPQSKIQDHNHNPSPSSHIPDEHWYRPSHHPLHAANYYAYHNSYDALLNTMCYEGNLDCLQYCTFAPYARDTIASFSSACWSELMCNYTKTFNIRRDTVFYLYSLYQFPHFRRYLEQQDGYEQAFMHTYYTIRKDTQFGKSLQNLTQGWELGIRKNCKNFLRKALTGFGRSRAPSVYDFFTDQERVDAIRNHLGRPKMEFEKSFGERFIDGVIAYTNICSTFQDVGIPLSIAHRYLKEKITDCAAGTATAIAENARETAQAVQQGVTETVHGLATHPQETISNGFTHTKELAHQVVHVVTVVTSKCVRTLEDVALAAIPLEACRSTSIPAAQRTIARCKKVYKCGTQALEHAQAMTAFEWGHGIGNVICGIVKAEVFGLACGKAVTGIAHAARTAKNSESVLRIQKSLSSSLETVGEKLAVAGGRIEERLKKYALVGKRGQRVSQPAVATVGQSSASLNSASQLNGIEKQIVKSEVPTSSIAGSTKKYQNATIKLTADEIKAKYAERVNAISVLYEKEFLKIHVSLPDAEFVHHILDRHYPTGTNLWSRNGMRKSLFNQNEDFIPIALEAWEKGILVEPRTKIYDMQRTIGITSDGTSTSYVKIVERDSGGFLTMFPIHKV